MCADFPGRRVAALAVVLLSAALAPGQRLSPGADLDATKSLVAMIDGDLNSEHTQGAGIVFAVSGGWTYIATAYHVVRKGDARADKLKVRFFQQPLDTFDAEHLEDSKREFDLAVLRVKTDRLKFPFTRVANMDALEESQSVYAIGYPSGSARWDVIYQPGSIATVGSASIEVQYAYIKSGHSGGALIDENKMLVGMVPSTDGTTAQALRIDQVLQILRRDLKLPVELTRNNTAPVKPAVTSSVPQARQTPVSSTVPAPRSDYLRSPWLGIEIWQDGVRNPLLRDSALPGGDDLVRIPMKASPFEIRFPTAKAGSVVSITGSLDREILSQIRVGMKVDDVPYFNPGTGMADTAFGSGELWLTSEAHMALDWGGRLVPRPEGGGVVQFNSVLLLDSSGARNVTKPLPKGSRVFVVMLVQNESDTGPIRAGDFERFLLTF